MLAAFFGGILFSLSVDKILVVKTLFPGHIAPHYEFKSRRHRR